MPTSTLFRKAVSIFTTGVIVAVSGLGVATRHQTPTDFISSLRKKHSPKHQSRQKNTKQRRQKQQEAKDEGLQSIPNPETKSVEELDTPEPDDGQSEHHTEESNDEDPLENFKEVINALDLRKLQQAAFLVRLHRTMSQSGTTPELDEGLAQSCDIHPVPKSGSYNLAYLITFPDGVKWVARVPGHGFRGRWNDLDKSKMESEYQTLQYLRSRTSIPVPEVLHYNATCDFAGAPFALISCMEGTPLSDLWMHDLSEEKRLQVLSQIASCMSQLHVVSFKRLGMPEFEPSGKLKGIGKCIALMGHEFDPWHHTESHGPHSTFLESLWDAFDEHEDMHVNQRADIPILRMAIKSMPHYLTEDRNFYLNFCDFNYQNILVDDQCHITGFIDWDDTQSEATAAGYARFPSWITRDWDPIMYDYDEGAPLKGASANESSPGTLSRYRKHYASEFIKHAESFEDYDPRMTTLSHIVEAIRLAVTSTTNRSDIVSKLLEHAFDNKVPFRYAEYVRDYIEGRRSKKDKLIEKAFAKMWSAEWEEPTPAATDSCGGSDSETSVTSIDLADSIEVDQIHNSEKLVEVDITEAWAEYGYLMEYEAHECPGIDVVQHSHSQQELLYLHESQKDHITGQEDQQDWQEGQNTEPENHEDEQEEQNTVQEKQGNVEEEQECQAIADNHQYNEQQQDEVVEIKVYADQSVADDLCHDIKQKKAHRSFATFLKLKDRKKGTITHLKIKKQARKILGVFKNKNRCSSESSVDSGYSSQPKEA